MCSGERQNGCSRIGEKSRKKPSEAIKKNCNEEDTKIQPALEFCKQVRHELWESVRPSVNNALGCIYSCQVWLD